MWGSPFDIAGREVEFDSFPDVRAGFLLGFTGRRAAGEFGAHRRVVTAPGIVFQNDSERHTNRIGPLPQPAGTGLSHSAALLACGKRNVNGVTGIIAEGYRECSVRPRFLR